jgi:hypothetical protein
MLSRRQFLHLAASGVAAETLLSHLDAALRAEVEFGFQSSEVHLKKRQFAQNKSYGSGNFGDWITDPQGLPCFEYTCNQTEDPFAATPVETAWRAATDHTHQVGNDRIVAAVSNYGYLQVRQDEGGARLLNDYCPGAGLYGAGLGYLTDGKEILGTYYPGNGQSFERFFGMGYYRKRNLGTNFSIDQTIYAPFGDDPVLISEVTISSQAPATANLLWAEYWGCQVYPLSYSDFVDGQVATVLGEQPDPLAINRLRRESARQYEHRFERVPGIDALVESKKLAEAARQPVAIQEEFAGDTEIAKQAVGGAIAEAQPPPSTFFACLDEGPVTFLTRANEFFGHANSLRHVGPAGPESVPTPEGLLHPAGLAAFTAAGGIPEKPAPDDLSGSGPESALIVLKPIILEAGKSVTLRFLYGYLPEGFTAAGLVAKYRVEAPGLFARSCAAWKDEGIQLAVDSEAWIERETRWHSYYLRSGFTYDDFSGEHIVSQGSVYQYCKGLQGAPRDWLQHALPLVYGDSALAKQVLRYTLKTQAADGSLPAAIAGYGSAIQGAPPSDLNLWLLWVASEYVLATRDTAFLEEKLSNYPLRPGSDSGPLHTVREKLDRAYRYLATTVGTGKHGLMRGLGGDWNDQIYFRNVPEKHLAEVAEHSESLMNAAMGAYVFEHYARMLRYVGAPKAAIDDATNYAAQQQNAVREQWAGRWFQRLWLGPAEGWLTPGRMWLDAQPWAILGGGATAEQQRILARSIDELTRRPSRIGAKQIGYPDGTKHIDWPGVVAGETKNGGIYDTLTGPLIWALAGIDPPMAYEEWTKNSRARHAEVYPDVWYGVWSGPDVFCSADSEHAGQTGYDWGLADPEAGGRPNSYRGLSWTAWPVMNMHRHAWPLYSAAKLSGIEFTEDGVELRPSIPKAQWSFRSKLVGLEKTPKGYSGWYAPGEAGNWTIRIKLAADERNLKTLVVNEIVSQIAGAPDDMIRFTGVSTLDQPLRWSLRED